MGADSFDILIVGGGAAGFFCALSIAELNPAKKITILEASNRTLRKVKISGGGRCNLTHNCFEPRSLTSHYPRGSKELLGPFFNWQPEDMIEWFNRREVSTKVESDGRIFPASNKSQTVIDCFESEAKKFGISIRKNSLVRKIQRSRSKELWELKLANEEIYRAPKLCIASGSMKNSLIIKSLEQLGHRINNTVPSLFSFDLDNHPFRRLAGVSVQSVRVSIPDLNLSQVGPVLFTHRGISGPAVIKLSAWAAQALHLKNYKFNIEINWLENHDYERVEEKIEEFRRSLAKSSVFTCPFRELPRRFWRELLIPLNLKPDLSWAHLKERDSSAIVRSVVNCSLKVDGKTTNKEEFVTCGGVDLLEVDFRTMESKKAPNLFFAGECLDLDGVTGGFNFQSAWTTARIAARRMSE